MNPKPWLAYSVTGPSHQSIAVSIDHGTNDGRRTLCGIPCGGSDSTVTFDPARPFTCKRCAKRLARLAAGPESQ